MAIMYSVILLFLFSIGSANAQIAEKNPVWEYTWQDKLKRDLFVNYDKFARPSDHKNTTNLSIALTIRHIELDELKSIFTIVGWLKMSWNDDKLKWNSHKYGYLHILHVGDHEVWQPDLALYNSAHGDSLDHFGNSHCLIMSDGSVLWVPPLQFQVFCQLDLRFWPFDSQSCDILLGSWTYNTYQINISVDPTPIFVEQLIENHEWTITNISGISQTKYYPCCEEPYGHIMFNIKIERRSPMYKAIVITPAICIILLTLSCFWLPPQSGEKIILNGINIIAICIFLIYFAQNLPAMALHTPLIVTFYSTSLYLVTISMIISVMVLYMSNSKSNRPAPRFVKWISTGWQGRILGINNLSTPKSKTESNSEELRDPPFEEQTNADDRHIISNTVQRTSIQRDWLILATIIDRIAFFIYCVIFVVLAITYSI